jgi:putative FmdB family regulatory protein
VRYNAPLLSDRESKGNSKMPVYLYHCDACGVQFEQQQSFQDQPLVRCPECGKKALKKVYQPVGIVFKGSGFYATDHHSASGQKPASPKSEKKDEKKTGQESASKESKPEPASDKDKKE